jgi:HNH endonuclease
MRAPKLTVDRLKQVYLYVPETGQFLRLQETNSHNGKAKVGEPAGSLSGERYIRIGIDGRVYRAHRLAWFYMTGEWPEYGVDHIDLDPTNNRWENLRAADQSQNAVNTRRRKDNTSGFKGVSKTANGRWQARLYVKGKKIVVGTYATPQEAFNAYRTEADKHFGSFHRTE